MNADIFPDIRILDVFEYFDTPTLFSCVAPAGQLYIAYYLTETKDTADFLYVPVSRERPQKAKKGLVDIRSLFLEAEEKRVYKLTINRRNQRVPVVDTIECNKLDQALLPPADELLMDEASNSTFEAFMRMMKEDSVTVRKPEGWEHGAFCFSPGPYEDKAA